MTGPTLAIALALVLGAGEPPVAPDPPAPAGPAAVPWGPEERMDLVIDDLGITMGRVRISVGRTGDGVTPVHLSSRSAGLMAVVPAPPPGAAPPATP